MNTNQNNWKQYIVTVGGIDFRPVSMGSLTLLYQINSPLVIGGDIEPLDYCIFAWIHAAPIMEVISSITSGNYISKAVIWGSEAPPTLYASYVPDTLAQLARDIQNVFIDQKTGYIPFPLPSPCRRSWWHKGWITIKRLLGIG